MLLRKIFGAFERKVAVLFIVIIFATFTFGSPALAETRKGSLFPSTLSSLINKTRASKHLKTLVVSSDLNKVAQMKAEHMAKYGYFSHTSPSGKTPWYWFRLVGYQYDYAGENLAMSYTDPSKLARAWMQSSAHKSNIVDKHYTEVGTGVAVGTWNGKKVTFVAQVYANPADRI